MLSCLSISDKSRAVMQQVKKYNKKLPIMELENRQRAVLRVYCSNNKCKLLRKNTTTNRTLKQWNILYFFLYFLKPSILTIRITFDAGDCSRTYANTSSWSFNTKNGYCYYNYDSQTVRFYLMITEYFRIQSHLCKLPPPNNDHPTTKITLNSDSIQQK